MCPNTKKGASLIRQYYIPTLPEEASDSIFLGYLLQVFYDRRESSIRPFNLII